MVGREVVQSLWVGEALSSMERLSIASFLASGHAYHLYAYGEVANVPPGTQLRDAREILPESMIFQYPRYPSYAGFSNFFRYKLLAGRGGWWVDTDAVCLRPFDFADAYVIGTERTIEGETIPTSGFLKAPAGGEAMAFAWEQCLGKDPGRLVWGETGPRLVAEVVLRFDLGRYLRDPETFAPVPHFAWERVLEPGWDGNFPASTHAVHLWNEKWRRVGQDKDARYPPDCLYERWKARFL